MGLVSLNITAQKINPDTLNFKQLNQYIVKAEKMKNAGMNLTIAGAGIVTAGYIISSFWSSTVSSEGRDVFKTLIPLGLGLLVGIPSSIVGISLWAVGASRNTKAEIALRKFDINTNHSMAVGIGITIRF